MRSRVDYEHKLSFPEVQGSTLPAPHLDIFSEGSLKKNDCRSGDPQGKSPLVKVGERDHHIETKHCAEKYLRISYQNGDATKSP